MMGSVRCPSYSRAVRGLHNADRSPPPDYKSNRNGKRNEVIETIDDFIETQFDKFVARRQNERIDVLPNQFDRMILTF